MLPWIQTHAQVQACQDRARSDAQNGVQYDAQDNTHDDNQLDDDYHDEDSDQDHNQDHGQAQSQARSQTLFPRWHRHYPLETFLRLKEILSLREWDPNLYLMAPSDFTSISVNEARNADLLGRLKARYFRSLIGASPTTSLITTRTLRTPSGRGIGDGEAGMC
ncbi:hypothetical protein K461DRAFT_274164 [Myriangium duriaei CBS 260.36]|uniref:Uncharacterized protein n=1 Tax=Myriangium duriaei CBS 260.36 TaxID=1168546 RepID=A0A9P4JA96_9PEZI|nr:hypothetical protein K461DRAFT_274164 [Myriangium duriaei CBS 260.36]